MLLLLFFSPASSGFLGKLQEAHLTTVIWKYSVPTIYNQLQPPSATSYRWCAYGLQFTNTRLPSPLCVHHGHLSCYTIKIYPTQQISFGDLVIFRQLTHLNMTE